MSPKNRCTTNRQIGLSASIKPDLVSPFPDLLATIDNNEDVHNVHNVHDVYRSHVEALMLASYQASNVVLPSSGGDLVQAVKAWHCHVPRIFVIWAKSRDNKGSMR
jgi:hypothetical protein